MLSYQHILYFKIYELIDELENLKGIYREQKDELTINDDNYGK